MDPNRLARFLQATLASWQVAGTVQVDPVTGTLVVRGSRDALATIERSPAGDPFRWYVRWHEGASADATARMRPCGSLVGVLSALRRAFGVERGSAIRIAPVPEENEDSGPDATAASSAGSRAERSMPHADACRPGGSGTGFGERIPVSVITGFLGSGKTTLVAQMLRHPAMGRTAVIVNEFGEIGLDHDLIEVSDESFVQLSTGCLCCNVRSDLVRTLADLAARRRRGEVTAFERVVIETSGLADPGPILHALMTDRGLCDAYVLDAVVTTVDAITGAQALDRHPESVRQVAVADTILLTKTDLPQARADELEALLRRRNGDARVMRAVRGDISPAALFARGDSVAASPVLLAQGAEAPSLGKPPGKVPAHAHTDGIGTFSLLRTQPVHAAALALFVSALADNCGPDLLRVKGIAQVAERPERPAVVHGVQHVYFAPRWLARWPSDDRRTRIVFIGRSIRAAWVEELLDLLDAEVAQTTAARGLAA
jgi:G3E family GTPase